MSVNIEDYKNEKGGVDWKAFSKAKKAAGEECFSCGHFMLFPNGRISFCGNCERLKNNTCEATHHSRIRCPSCKHIYEVSNDLHEDFNGDSFGTYCPECDHLINVIVTTSYVYTSPALLSKETT